MPDAAQAKLHLPDPGKYFMLVLRHGSVELAACINPENIDDDAALQQIAVALRNNVKRELSLTTPNPTLQPPER